MSEIMVSGYQINYAVLTNQFEKLYPLMYKQYIFQFKLHEARKGMVIHRMNKPNRNGTIVTYKAGSKEQLEKYIDELEKEYIELFTK